MGKKLKICQLFSGKKGCKFDNFGARKKRCRFDKKKGADLTTSLGVGLSSQLYCGLTCLMCSPWASHFRRNLNKSSVVLDCLILLYMEAKEHAR